MFSWIFGLPPPLSKPFPRRGVLESCVDQVVAADVATLERIGGGSVRCMVAELFKRRGREEPGAQRFFDDFHSFLMIFI